MGRYGEREAGGIRGHNIFLRRRRAPCSARSHSAFDHRPCPSLCARSYISTWTRSTLPWNSATTRAARLPVVVAGPDRARWSARPRTRRGASACIRPCRRCARSALSAGGLCAARFQPLPRSLAPVRQIYARHTDLIEPLSLDEAYRRDRQQGRAAVRHRGRAGHPPPDPPGNRADRLGRRGAQQVPCQDRLRLEQARRPVRHPALEGAGVPAPLPVRKVPGVGR